MSATWVGSQLLSQRVEVHLIAPNHCWFTTQVRGIMHRWPVNVSAQKHFCDVHHLLLARIQACNFSFYLPGSTLLESTYKSLLQSQGGFFLLSHKQVLLRFHSLRSKHAFIPIPKNWLHMLAVFTSLTRNININLIRQRHTDFMFFPPLLLTKMLSEFGETWLKSSSKIILQCKDSIE